MDRLFRKRTTSQADQTARPGTLKKSPTQIQHVQPDDGFSPDVQPNPTQKISREPPSLNVDIRNSLILPGLSQRFSVLLPTLSTAPETTLRSLLASQRARHNGPSLTEEEEELFFEEIREVKPINRSFGVAGNDRPPNSAPVIPDGRWPDSPPPTSSSFTSFQTFGVADGVKVKSYGFSGGSSLRESEYLRRIKKSSSGRNISGSISSIHSEGLEDTGEVEVKSDGTATPTPTSAPQVESSLSHEALARQLSLAASSRNKRQSRLAGLAPAQVKRISMALGEIEGQLSRNVVELPQNSDVDAVEEVEEASADGEEEPVVNVSPTKLPPSPRSHNLVAHLEPSVRSPPVPQPIMTPSRTTPVRHTPNSSVSSIKQDPAVYIPGQPRPIRSMHRSEGSVSSRAATPNTNPATSPSITYQDRSPTPNTGVSLGRSLSAAGTRAPVSLSDIGANLQRSATSASRSPDPSSGFRASPASATGSMRLAGARPSLSGGIGEEDEDEDERSAETQPRVQRVASRRHVTQNLQAPTDPLDVHQAGPGTSSRAVSQEGTISSSDLSEMAHISSFPSANRSSETVNSDFQDSDDDVWSPRSKSYKPNFAQPAPSIDWLDKADLMDIQNKLVKKAQTERVALRGVEDMPVAQSEQHPGQDPNHMPPDLPLPESPASPVTPSDLVHDSTPLVRHPAFDVPKRTAPAPPPVPAETPSGELEVVTPTTVTKSRPEPSAEEDAKRRDFEARVAAATAALNRTPSAAQPRLERKNTKKGAAMVISSPTLVSSSTKLSGTALVTPPGISPTTKALERASGSSSKMSMRWRKLGFKKQSVSGTAALASPPPTADRLEDAIALKQTPPVPSGSTVSPNLNAFRFPTNQGSLPSRIRDAVAPRNLHTPSSSSDSAVAKFVEAGRAVGLSDDELNEMLIAKGMVPRQSEAPVASNPVNGNVAPPTKSPVAAQDSRLKSPVPAPSPVIADKPSKNLFRALSRSKKAKPAAEIPPLLSEPLPTRAQIVRRTLLVPTEAAGPESTVMNGPASPSSSRDQYGQRKNSIKRKPVNFTREDQALVSESPSSQSRKPSAASSSKTENAGLGFLNPQSALEPPGSIKSDSASLRPSSTDGSLYDLYGDESQDAVQELLSSPRKGQAQSGSEIRRSAQAVEITEYADGQMVWSLVDALRQNEPDEESDGEGDFAYPQPHSRSQSVDSAGVGPTDTFSGTRPRPTVEGLNFRHRDRNASQVRPPTNVYFTSSADVADLIDHLSRDQDASKGRIDILGGTRQFSPNPPAISGQFEDAPSPRKGPPPPIYAPKHNYARSHDMSPHRRVFKHSQNSLSIGSGMGVSPSAASFNSSDSGPPGRSVEDRLQALLDKLKESREPVSARDA